MNALRDLRVRNTGSKAKIDASLAFRSVGYQSEALAGFDDLGIPFDQKLGIILMTCTAESLPPTVVPSPDYLLLISQACTVLAG